MAIADFAAVIAAAQTGAEWAIAVLYRAYAPALTRFFGGRSVRDAEDLTQEVWLAAGPKLATFVGDEAGFRAWLFTFARRRLIEHWRKTARRPVTTAAQIDYVDPDADPADLTVSASGVTRLIATLPDDQAEVILLRVIADLDAKSVAQIVGKSEGSVRVLQHRALRRLAKELPERAVTK